MKSEDFILERKIKKSNYGVLWSGKWKGERVLFHKLMTDFQDWDVYYFAYEASKLMFASFLQKFLFINFYRFFSIQRKVNCRKTNFCANFWQFIPIIHLGVSSKRKEFYFQSFFPREKVSFQWKE